MELTTICKVIALRIALFCLLFVPLWSQSRFYTTRTATQCLSSPGAPRLEFSACEPGHMILIHEAFQGISQSPGPGDCGYRRGDCLGHVTPETEAKLYQCIGAQSCQLDINVSWMPQCRAYSDYNFVIYTCVAREDMMDMCESKTRRMFRTGYIMSHGYPANYKNDLECNCNITTEPSQKLLLTFSDFAIEWSEDCYKDVLKIKDGDFEISRCGRLVRNHNITSETNRMELTWKTDGWREHKGFWLQVEALGSIRIECASNNPSVTTFTPVITSETPPNKVTHSTVAPSDSFTEENTLNFDRKYPGSTLDVAKFNNLNTISGDENFKDLNNYDQNRNEQNRILTDDTILQTDINNMEHELDIFLTNDFYDSHVTRDHQAGDSSFDLGGRDITRDLIQPTELGEPSSKAPLFVISPVVGIIIGCSLLVVLVLLLLCVALWCKKHRRKKAITTHNKTTEPRLMRHSFPRINSPRPRMHTPRQRIHIPRPHISSPRPSVSQQFQGAVHYPESPAGSCHSYGSDFSLASGKSGLKRGDRVKKDRHYKKARRSPRLDFCATGPEEQHHMDSDGP